MPELKHKDITEKIIGTPYDIVNAHVGDLKVETKAGNGAEFIILLPLK